MAHRQSMDTLKEALLLERRGRAFYQKVAAQTDNRAVRDFFVLMADEELRHMQILGEQYEVYAKTEQFAALDARETAGKPLADLVLSEDVKKQLAGADFEAAAISAAVLLEEKAVALYSGRADAAEDPNEKILFQWLADWEQGHLSFLAKLDHDIKQQIWNDRQFWPF